MAVMTVEAATAVAVEADTVEAVMGEAVMMMGEGGRCDSGGGDRGDSEGVGGEHGG